MTNDPREALASLQRIAEARREIVVRREALTQLVSQVRQAKADLLKAERDCERLMDGETGELPLFDQAVAPAPAPVAVSLDPITKHGQPPGTLGHKLGAGAIGDPEPQPAPIQEPAAKSRLSQHIEAIEAGANNWDAMEVSTKVSDAASKPIESTRSNPAKPFTGAQLHAATRAALKLVDSSIDLPRMKSDGATDEEILAALATWPKPSEAKVLSVDGLDFLAMGGPKPGLWIDAKARTYQRGMRPTLSGEFLLQTIRFACGISKPVEAKDGPPGGTPKPPAKPTKPGKPKPAVNAEAERVALNLLLCEAIELIPATSLTMARDRGATDDQIKDLLATSWGSVHNHNQPSPHRDFTARGGDSPAFWTGALMTRPDQKTTKPSLQGVALIARVRQLAGIPTPTAVKRVRRLNRKLDWQARADQRRVESMPSMPFVE